MKLVIKGTPATALLIDVPSASGLPSASQLTSAKPIDMRRARQSREARGPDERRLAAEGRLTTGGRWVTTVTALTPGGESRAQSKAAMRRTKHGQPAEGSSASQPSEGEQLNFVSNISFMVRQSLRMSPTAVRTVVTVDSGSMAFRGGPWRRRCVT
ncbi:hypothetical protein CRUP_022928 [Coryphaenoides rupestris]|nr:hypothetical protein CRUP_022928 [Coryphaenoides rupestris]